MSAVEKGRFPWRRVRRSLVLIGAMTAGLAFVYFFFVYPRPSRLPDPLLALKGVASVGGPKGTESFRLADAATGSSLPVTRFSPRWEQGFSELKNYSYAADVSQSGGARLQAGIGLLKRGEMEAMDALFAPTPTDWTYTVEVPDEGRLSLAMAVLPFKAHPSAAARFGVRVSDPEDGGAAVTMMDRVVAAPAVGNRVEFLDEIHEYLNPDIRGRYGQWEKAEMDLSRWAGRTVRLVLSTRSNRSFADPLPAVWGNPVLSGRTASNPKPNVIVIMVDAMRPDALGAYGATRNATPNMDRLAREGILFTQARSASVDTRTSETAFFAGRYPGEIGIHYRNRGLAPVELRHFHALSLPTLAGRFAQEGYRTAAFVNNLFLLEFSGAGYDLGFEEIYNNNRTNLDTVDLTDRTVSWLARNRQHPFFLFLNYNSPHGRYRPPLKNLLQVANPVQIAGYDLQSGYLGSVAYVDEYVGVLRTALERLGLLEQTLIAITSDHGQIFDLAHDVGVPDRDVWTYNRHGYTLYDEEIRVPLILRLPGEIQAGRVVEDPVSHVDIFPTVFEWAGLPVPDGLSGRSLVPLIRGGSLPPRPIYADGRYMKAVVQDGVKYVHREGPAARLLIRTTEGERLVHLPDELYDLNQDPQEHRNRMGPEDDRPDATARRMRELFRNEAPRDLTVNHVRLAAGRERHRFAGLVSVTGGSGNRIRFFEAVPGRPYTKIRSNNETTLAFSSDLAGGQSSGFFFETEPPAAPIRLDLMMDGRPIEAERLYGGPMGLVGFIRPGQSLSMPDLAFLDSGGGVFKKPPFDPRVETGVFIWRTPYLDYVSASDGNSGLSREVRDILLDWGYIQKDEK